MIIVWKITVTVVGFFFARGIQVYQGANWSWVEGDVKFCVKLF